VTIVSDGSTILTDVAHAGDEPFMLARALPGVAVLVGARRFLSGRLAEDTLGATVHLLDDGFQHLQLERDVDLLMANAADLREPTLPAGRLRESCDAARVADAALVDEENPEAAARIGHALGIATVFRVERRLGVPRWLKETTIATIDRATPVFAVAGIARPARFFDLLASAGWNVAGTMSFRDHHWFSAGDIEQFAAAAREAGAEVILTTEKDAVRLSSALETRPPIAIVPLTVGIEPGKAFDDWLQGRLTAARR
jgi:tetraacyldisaccharide 4'-kinase